MSPFFGNHGSRSASMKHKIDSVQSDTSSETSQPTSMTKNNHLSKGNSTIKTNEGGLETFHVHKISSTHASTQSPVGSRKGSTTNTFKIGDEVYLSTKNYVSARPARRLDQEYAGPYKVTKVINSQFYQLKLPDELDPSHNIFHVSLLIPVQRDPLLNLIKTPQPLKATDSSGKTLWVVDKVVDTKRPDGKLYYFVRWRGATERDKTWEPPPNLVTAIITKESSVNGQKVIHKIYIILL